MKNSIKIKLLITLTRFVFNSPLVEVALLSNKIFGYARVSTADQHLDRQLAILREYGVAELDIFTDKISGRKLQRPSFDSLQLILRPGDTVLTESLSRLSRSSDDLLAILRDWDERGVVYISLKERFDLSTPAGALMLRLMAALSEFERDVTHARIMEGLAEARARGRKGGRPRTDPKKLEKALRLYDTRSHSVREITELTGVSQGVLYSALKRQENAGSP
ncbi:recombinase family protein [Brevibacillus brevis]|uniref:recombinase family protein n=1 Tax=Brevibacillus brevis TaxID=1393 RepID=UPI0037CA3A76